MTTATAIERDGRANATANRADAASMSLSRRLLSLPQELEGVSLPPQVAGDRHGVLTLAVPHILESAAAPRALPPVSLVRVRWWGEEKPGGLFRPALLSPSGQDGHVGPSGSDESPYSISPRTIAMRYPVRVPADRLLEYFQDMVRGFSCCCTVCSKVLTLVFAFRSLLVAESAADGRGRPRHAKEVWLLLVVAASPGRRGFDGRSC